MVAQTEVANEITPLDLQVGRFQNPLTTRISIINIADKMHCQILQQKLPRLVAGVTSKSTKTDVVEHLHALLRLRRLNTMQNTLLCLPNTAASEVRVAHVQDLVPRHPLLRIFGVGTLDQDLVRGHGFEELAVKDTRGIA